MRRVLRGALFVALGTSAAFAVRAGAQEPTSETSVEGPTYVVDPLVDVPLLVLPALISASYTVASEGPPPRCAPLCDRDDVAGIDRGAAGNYSPGWSAFTDVTLGVNAAGLAATVVVAEGLGPGLVDILVIAEAGLWGTATATITNTATRRPRPLMYGVAAPESVRRDPKSALSFFSGHTTFTAAVSTATFYTLMQRDPGAVAPWIALGVGSIATGSVAVGRVLAGKHFPTDVMAGVLAGSSIGLLVPALHASPVAAQPVVTPEAASLVVSGLF